MKLRFYGADRCVTGSCHCLEVNGKHILVDCGLQQGRDEIDNTALPFHPGSIDVVLVTGGTGMFPRDVTPDAVQVLFDKEIPGFGELFRYVSYE